MAAVESEVIKMTNDITAERLRELLHYDPDTGWFTWLVSRGRWGGINADARAGGLDSNSGYRRIRINGKLHYEHRLVWLWRHGAMPTHRIDHINNVRDDNRLSNLREATHVQNLANVGLSVNNTSGHKGVYWAKRDQRWRAQIGDNYKLVSLGGFVNLEDAAAAYRAAALARHGEFAYKGTTT
jgi:hypothetical protein